MNTLTNKKLAILDIDGTLVKGQSQQIFIAYLKDKGYISTFNYLVIMVWFALYKLHIVTKPKKILSFALQIFKGKSVQEVDMLVGAFVADEISNRYYTNTKKLLEVLQVQDYEIVLLSSAVEPIVRAIAKDLKVEKYICTKLSQIDSNLDGKTEGVQVYSDEKLNKIKSYTAQLAATGKIYNETLAVADHYSDISVLQWASKAIVANPQVNMKKWATQNKVPMIYLDDNESIQYVESHIVSQ